MMDNKGGDQDMGDGMQCSYHPNKNNPGGICAFCLQEKLGKLVSSSFPLPIRMSTSSSSSPPFRSENGGLIGIGASRNTHASVAPSIALPLSVSIRHKLNKSRTDCSNDNREYSNSIKSSKTRIPFLSAKKKKKIITNAASSSSYSDPSADIVFKRSKSTVTPRNRHFAMDSTDTEDFSPRQKRSGFWSFLYLASSNKSNSNPNIIPTVTTAKRMNKSASMASHRSSVILKPPASSLSKKPEFGGSSNHNTVAVEEDDDVSPNSTQASGSTTSSFERKVSRSRSVGCGSRSFSGDFFERISTGLGDCTLRRVESQREGKSKVNTSSSAIKERVKCGGIFSGFILSSSSSSISSSYWISSSSTENVNQKQHQHLGHGKNSKSWGWAFSSPMRAFSKPPSKDAKTVNNNNNTPNLAAIPSLLTVRS